MGLGIRPPFCPFHETVQLTDPSCVNQVLYCTFPLQHAQQRAWQAPATPTELARQLGALDTAWQREKGDLLAGAVLAGRAKPHLQELPGGLLLLLFQLGDQVAEVGDVARELSDGTIDTVVDGQV